MSASDLMARAQAEVASAQHEAKAFEAAANCFLQTGVKSAG
jgi:hypothetical protein